MLNSIFLESGFDKSTSMTLLPILEVASGPHDIAETW